MSGVSPGLLMTLAGIAYGKPGNIPGYLAADALTAGEWSVAWIAADQGAPPNFAFAARSADTGAVVLAIRGTYPDPFSSAYWDDGRQDSPFGGMVAWPYAPGAGAHVSAGTFEGFSNVVALADDAGVTLAAWIAALPAETELWITGHSLGGTLAPVVALWSTTLSPARAPKVATFAGMTPGDAAFAALFGPRTALDGHVVRYFNTLDTVAYGWNDVMGTVGFYDPAPKGGPAVDAILALTAWRLRDADYTPVGEPVAIVGKLEPPAVSFSLIAYVIENLRQHLPDTYLALLGAPPLPFSNGFGAVVGPREQAVPGEPRRPAVTFI